MVLDRGEVGTETSIDLDDASESDLKKGNERRAEVPNSHCQFVCSFVAN